MIKIYVILALASLSAAPDPARVTCQWIGPSAGNDQWCDDNCNAHPPTCPPDSCSCSSGKGGTDCYVGDHVDAKWAGDGKRYKAHIATINHDQTVAVDWDDGGTTYRQVKLDDVKKGKDRCNPISFVACHVGDSVSAKWSDDGRYYGGHIASINADGSMMVNWNDSGSDKVAAADIRKNGNICNPGAVVPTAPPTNSPVVTPTPAPNAPTTEPTTEPTLANASAGGGDENMAQPSDQLISSEHIAILVIVLCLVLCLCLTALFQKKRSRVASAYDQLSSRA